MDTLQVKFHCNTSWCPISAIFWNYLLHYNVNWSSLGNSKSNWLPLSQCHIIWNVTCVTKKKHIGKAIGNNTKRYEVTINQQISDCKTAVSTCKFRRHVYDCGIKNNCPEEPFFSLNIMFRLSKSDRLEAIEKHFHSKDHDTTSNSGRN